MLLLRYKISYKWLQVRSSFYQMYHSAVANKGRDTRCDKSLRHVAATGCCNKSPRVTCENNCRRDRILSLRSVARIQTGLNSCDLSQRPNKRKALSQQQCRRGDLSPRRVAAICRIVCLGLKRSLFPRFITAAHACTRVSLQC